MELIKENLRVMEYGLYDPKGLLFGCFRYKADAEACAREGMTVSEIEIKPQMNINTDNGKSYPVDCYITLLAVPV